MAAHVGDSRLYELVVVKLRQRAVDHNLRNELAALGLEGTEATPGVFAWMLLFPSSAARIALSASMRSVGRPRAVRDCCCVPTACMVLSPGAR